MSNVLCSAFTLLEEELINHPDVSVSLSGLMAWHERFVREFAARQLAYRREIRAITTRRRRAYIRKGWRRQRLLRLLTLGYSG